MKAAEIVHKVMSSIWCVDKVELLSNIEEGYAQFKLSNNEEAPVRVSGEDLDDLRKKGFDEVAISYMFNVVTIEVYWNQEQFNEPKRKPKSKRSKSRA